MDIHSQVRCPDCGLALGAASLIPEEGLPCPGCGFVVTVESASYFDVAPSMRQRATAVEGNHHRGEFLIPWVVGLLATLVLVVALSKILSCAFDLNGFGVLAACASSFLALMGDGFDPALKQTEP